MTPDVTDRSDQSTYWTISGSLVAAVVREPCFGVCSISCLVGVADCYLLCLFYDITPPRTHLHPLVHFAPDWILWTTDSEFGFHLLNPVDFVSRLFKRTSWLMAGSHFSVQQPSYSNLRVNISSYLVAISTEEPKTSYLSQINKLVDYLIKSQLINKYFW